MDDIQFSGSLPKHPRPIYMIGAGGIVNDAHLPAYAIAGFKVAGIYDIIKEQATATARKFEIPVVFDSIENMLQNLPGDAVFDVAVPGAQLLNVLQLLPHRSAVLMQKPMGDNYAEAKKILQLCRDKQFIAGVNFQLRYAPFIHAARSMINRGSIGKLCDVEFNINVYTPWHLWQFLFEAPRVEILYHSIHHMDLVRSLLGNPLGIYAKTVKHPLQKELASVRSNIIMDYGDLIRANILTNHCHHFGLQNQQSYIKLEGTTGAIRIDLGVLMNYPQGMPDKLEYIFTGGEGMTAWKSVTIEGKWFPHAFIGSMAQIMLAAEGSIARPDNSVEDCIYTMACVEAAYQSSEGGGVKLKDIV
jgi:predicted dehydrogenase